VPGNKDRIRSILSDSLLFRTLDANQLETLVGIARLETVREATLLYDQGRPSKGVYIVGSGQVKVFQNSPDGKEYIIHIVGPGRTFAEAATFGHVNCPASARAIERSELVLLPAERLTQLLSSDGNLCFQMLKGISVWLCQLVRTLENVVLRDSLGRVAGYLMSLVGPETSAPTTVRLPIKKRDLAAHLALTPETLSRTLARLAELDAIKQLEGGEIQLLSPETLKGLAEA